MQSIAGHCSAEIPIKQINEKIILTSSAWSIILNKITLEILGNSKLSKTISYSGSYLVTCFNIVKMAKKEIFSPAFELGLCSHNI